MYLNHSSHVSLCHLYAIVALLMAIVLLAGTSLASQPPIAQDNAEVTSDKLTPPDAALSQSVADKPVVAVLFNPVALTLGLATGLALFVELQLQIRLTDYLALDVTPTYARLLWFSEFNIHGGGVGIGVRILPLGRGIRGLYIVPRVQFLRVSGGTGEDKVSTVVTTPMIEVGWAWIWGHFAMNLGAGVGYSTVTSGEDIYEDHRQVTLILNFSIGFAV